MESIAGFDGQPGALEAVAVGRGLEASLVGGPHRNVQGFPAHAGELLAIGAEPRGAHLDEAGALSDHVLDALQQFLGSFGGPGEPSGPGARELKPFSRSDDPRPQDGPSGGLPRDVDVDGMAGANIPGRGDAGHQCPAAVPHGLEGEFLGCVVQQAAHGVHATVPREVLMAVNEPGDKGQTLSVDVLLVPSPFRLGRFLSHPSDCSVGYFQAYGRLWTGSCSIDQSDVANYQVHHILLTLFVIPGYLHLP